MDLQLGKPQSTIIKDYTFLLKITITASLGAFNYGYTLTYFNTIQYSQILSIFDLYDYPQALTQGLLTGSATITAALGSLISYFFFHKYSRLQCLKIICLYGIFTTLFCLIPHVFFLVMARLLQGFNIGFISALNAIYVRQMMPKEISGKMWTLHQFFFTGGLASSFIFVFFYSRVLGIEEKKYWRLIFGFPIVPYVLQFYLFTFFFPYDTPKSLISKGNIDEAKQILILLYRPSSVEKQYQQIAENFKQSPMELEEIGNKRQKLLPLSNASIMKQQTQILPTNTVAITVGICLAFFQQFYGQPTIVQYGIEITDRTFPALWNSFPVIINLSGSLGSILSIFFVSKYGRKKLMVKGGGSAIILLLVISFSFLVIQTKNPTDSPLLPRLLICVSVLILRILAGITVGPITWLIMSQIVQPHIMSICSAMNWISLSIVNIMFPVMMDWNDDNPSLAYFCFTLISLTAVMINSKFLIETSNKSELQIRREYDSKWPNC